MIKNNKKYFLKAFTIAEVLVTLALTSFVITLSYTTLTYIQKLVYSYKIQSKFIQEYTDFQNRMNYEAFKSNIIFEDNENIFVIKRDTVTISLEVLDQLILFKKDNKCDTFHLAAKKVRKEYELIKNPFWRNKVLTSLTIEFEFTKQKYNFYFHKNYDSAVKLKLEQNK